MNKMNKVHRSGALGFLLNEGDLPTITTVKNQKEETQKIAHLFPEGDQYTEMDPNIIKNWVLNDRPESELGDIEAFAKELKEVGQQQPCIIRPISDAKYQYEIIAGERRWRAAKHADIKLKVIIRALDDHEAAIVQASENAHRKDLSDYAKGMSYAKLIANNVLAPNELISKLSISKAQVSRLLSFAKIPQEVNEAIADYSKVTARTAAEIRSLAHKGDTYIQALIQLAPKIASGKLGGNKLISTVEKMIVEPVAHSSAKTIDVKTKNGTHCFSWKVDAKNNFSINFPSKISGIVEASRKNIESQLIDIIEKITKHV